MGSQGERWMRQPQWEMPLATGQGRDRSSRNLPTEAATEGSGGAVRTPTPPGRNGQREGLWGPLQHQALPPRPPSPQCTQLSSLLSPAQRESHHQESSGTSKHRGEKQQQEGPRGGGNGGRNGLWRDRRDSRAGGGGGWGAIAFKPGRDEDGGHKSISALVPVLSSQSRHLRQRERPHAPAAHRVR